MHSEYYMATKHVEIQVDAVDTLCDTSGFFLYKILSAVKGLQN